MSRSAFFRAACPVLPVPLCLSRSTVPCCLSCLFCLTCSRCDVLPVTSGFRSRLSFSDCPFPSTIAVLFWPPCPGCSILTDMSLLSCPGDSALAICTDCLVQAVLFFLSLFGRPVLFVIFWLSCTGCTILAVLLQLSCPGCPVLAVLSRCPVQTVLLRHFVTASSLSISQYHRYNYYGWKTLQVFIQQ